MQADAFSALLKKATHCCGKRGYCAMFVAMLHSRRLLYINEIARLGSIRKAAERLNVASSAINRQILALEADIGTALFERLPRGLRMTTAGELYVEHIRDVLKSHKRLEARIRNLRSATTGQVTLVTTAGLAAGPLPPIIAKFMQDHPFVRVKLRNDSGSTTISPVVSGEVDIGLGFNIPATPGIRTLANFDIPIGAVLPPNHPLALQPKVHLADLAQERLILAQSGSSLRDLIDLIFAPLNVAIEPVMETNAPDMLKQMVRSGSGVTLLNPLDVIMECQRGELVFRPLADLHVRRQTMKVFARARTQIDAVTSVFVEFLLGELAELIQTLSLESAPGNGQPLEPKSAAIETGERI